MGCYVRVFIVSVFALLSGCASEPPPPPAVVSYLDIDQKQAYLQNAMETLKIFHDAAVDLRIRRKSVAREELAKEVDFYVKTQIDPIMRDFEANSHLETRLEVAELQLLCGLVYLELQEYKEVRSLLKNMKRRYGDNPEILSAAIDSRYIDFRNLEDGMRVLNARAWSEL